MRLKMATVKNIINLRSAYEALAQRGPGVEGMGLVYGSAGFGKSTALTWLRAQTNAVHVRALASWTPRAMLSAIMRELGHEPLHRVADMVPAIVKLLGDANRGLYVDELDYLVGGGQLSSALDSLRDIHDLSKMPVLLIGMEGVQRAIRSRLQLSRRITQWIEFLPADIDDARTLAEAVCEVTLDADLLADLHRQAGGNIGLMSNGLSRIEQFAKANGLTKKPIGPDNWGGRIFFLEQQSGPKK